MNARRPSKTDSGPMARESGTLTEGTAQNEIMKQWEALAVSQDALFKQMAQANSDLNQHVKQLQRELSVYRAGWVTLENEKEVLLAQKMQLEKTLDLYQNDKSLVICLIDGDGAIFDEKLVSRGKEGGREAASQLSQGIIRYVNSQQGNGNLPHRIQHQQIMANIFVNAVGLADTLTFNGIGSNKVFDDFILGFNQATPLFSIIDVGSGKEAADAKLRETLFFYSRLHQTRQVIFSGAHDSGYIPTLKSLQTEGLLDKITILKGGSRIAPEAQRFFKEVDLKIMDIPGLFLQRRLISGFQYNSPQNLPSEVIPLAAPGTAPIAPSPVPQMSAPSGMAYNEPPDSRVTPTTYRSPPTPPTKRPFISYSVLDLVRMGQAQEGSGRLLELDGHSEAQGSIQEHGTEVKKVIDPKKSIIKQTPPLCNFYYLTPSCPNGDTCNFSHDYDPTPGQLNAFRAQVKRKPCLNLSRGVTRTCPFTAETCLMSHYCPDGPSCARHQKGACYFKGPEMHNPPGSPYVPILLSSAIPIVTPGDYDNN